MHCLYVQFVECILSMYASSVRSYVCMSAFIYARIFESICSSKNEWNQIEWMKCSVQIFITVITVQEGRAGDDMKQLTQTKQNKTIEKEARLEHNEIFIY